MRLCGSGPARLRPGRWPNSPNAADRLGPDLKRQVLAEEGPAEVARASNAFNAMQRRIAGYMDERVEILAAISHDLQTPITRMRLRTELMDDEAERGKLQQDLDAMLALVKEGLTYARSLHGETEPARRLDLDALLGLDGLRLPGHRPPVTPRAARPAPPVTTRPQAHACAWWATSSTTRSSTAATRSYGSTVAAGPCR